MNNKPLFEQYADATLDAVRGTYAQRGNEYADTIGTIQPITLQAVLTKLGLPKLDRDALVALIAAALVDVKYWRGLGGFKDDNLIDGIAYSALLVGAVKKAVEAKAESIPAGLITMANQPTAKATTADKLREGMANLGYVEAKRGEPPINPGMTYFQHNTVGGQPCACDICGVYRANNP